MNRREFLTSAVAAAVATQLPAAAIANNPHRRFPVTQFDLNGWDVAVDLIRSNTCLGDFLSFICTKENHSDLHIPFWRIGENPIPALEDMMRVEYEWYHKNHQIEEGEIWSQYWKKCREELGTEVQAIDMSKQELPAWYWRILGYYPGEKVERKQITEARDRQRAFLDRHHGTDEDYVRLNLAYDEAKKLARD